MSFNDFLADLDATVFAELSDDTAALWTRSDGTIITLAVILGAGEQVVSVGGVQTIMPGEHVRMSAAEVHAKTGAAGTPGLPVEGDALTINGVTYVVHGEARYDEQVQGRDIVCPVSK